MNPALCEIAGNAEDADENVNDDNSVRNNNRNYFGDGKKIMTIILSQCHRLVRWVLLERPI